MVGRGSIGPNEVPVPEGGKKKLQESSFQFK